MTINKRLKIEDKAYNTVNKNEVRGALDRNMKKMLEQFNKVVGQFKQNN